MSIFYFFVLFLISSVKYNINYYTAIKKTYAFIIVTYAYYLREVLSISKIYRRRRYKYNTDKIAFVTIICWFDLRIM